MREGSMSGLGLGTEYTVTAGDRLRRVGPPLDIADALSAFHSAGKLRSLPGESMTLH
jgi:hypothetical protein